MGERDPNHTPCIPAYLPDVDDGEIGVAVQVIGSGPHNLATASVASSDRSRGLKNARAPTKAFPICSVGVDVRSSVHHHKRRQR